MKTLEIRLNNIVILILLLIAGYSCDSNRVFEQNIDIPNSGWHKDSVVYFSVDIADTTSTQSILLNLRYQNEYPKRNIYLFVNTFAPSGFAIRDTFEIMLADEKGQWYGSSLGGVWDYQQVFKQNIRFPVSGKYRFEIEQAMRYTVLPSIRSVGLRVEKVE